ncbi:hypothetical protein [Candidatus Endomicrobiellum trichonymphae]|uniref:hypothetical protein n=1 Tax=Endomicrobium trichonymphae TaxID=1408204 RepID=UPI00086493F0|nr:hypothetical protein [Candidatus Endomicrobium trichonymphae]BAV59316.1 hypothetical protein RSTT_P3-001 [Candidatus Endomicrobium trichonymphae]
MWNEIKTELTEKIPTIWLEPVKEESFKDDILMLNVPNRYYAEKYKTDFKELIQSVIKTKTGKDIGLQCQIELLPEPITKDKKPKTTSKTPLIKETKFNGKPYFESPAELTEISKEISQAKEIDVDNTKLTSMPVKYSIKDVVSFSLLNSKMFTYPNDKRKKTKVEINIRFNNGTIKPLDLYRGQLDFNDEGYGQLTTTHAKIFLAITHIWQKQGCKFANNSYLAVVDISIRELAKQLGYQKFSGADYKRLLRKTKELADFPMILADMYEAHTFTLLYDVSNHKLKKSRNNKNMLRILINPFIAKQLYERKVILRNPQCYKIKNPTAIKFLICYDKRIIKGNNLRLNISEIANDLEININNITSVAENLKNAFQELNGYELNDSYSLHVELIKEGKEWIVVADRLLKEKQQSLKVNCRTDIEREA